MLARFVRRVVALLGRFGSGEISLRELVVRSFRGLFRPVRTHTFTSYSQAQQDLLFALLLPGQGRVFVDIGARDGVVISNTYLLERQFGWRGLCIEPHPGLFQSATALLNMVIPLPEAVAAVDRVPVVVVCSSISVI